MDSMGTSITPPVSGAASMRAGSAAAAVFERAGRRAERPLPNALRVSLFLFIGENFLSELDVALGAFGADVVEKDGLSVTRSFGEAHASRYHGFEYLVDKELLQIVRNLAR